ncbi:MFS transporter [Pelagicoccus mobilis]|uniref:MFS transporter n=1 Tax=Pelagicoccus mobilis TaxID=415221 RepID=A0A934VQU1_9BACT|nr:MFS transporter [Pelagicoccus mobilis]MBK1876923.1 MFS transporter [Pelagicoccus mobilis]
MKTPLPFLKELIAEVCSMPRPVYVLVVGQFLNRFGAFVYPFLALYLKEKSFDFAQIAGVMAAMGVGNFVGPFAGGYLADAIGRRNTIVLSLTASATLLIGMYYAEHYGVLLLIGTVYGFSTFLFGPPSSALLTDLVPEEKRIMAFALFRLAINAGFAAGPAVAGILYVKSPMLIFFGDAFTTYLFAILAFCFLPHGLRTIEGNVTSPKVVLKSWMEAAVDVHRNIRFRRFLTAVLLMGIAFAQIFILLSILATDRGLTPEKYGLIMGWNGLLIIFVEMPASKWLKEKSPRLVLSIGYSLIGVGCAMFAVVEGFWGFFAAMSVFTIGEIIAIPLGMAYSSNLAPAKLRGRYFGFRGMTWAMSNLIASGGVWFYGQIGPMWWAMVGGVAVMGAAVIAMRIPVEVEREEGCAPSRL